MCSFCLTDTTNETVHKLLTSVSIAANATTKICVMSCTEHMKYLGKNEYGSKTNYGTKYNSSKI